MNFEQLGVIPTILTAIEKQGYTQATPIQEKSIPIVLNRSDLIGCAQTGTGKTAAFSIPILQLLYESPERKKHGKIRSLIVTPTRELAIQIGESIKLYGQGLNIRHAVIFGGVSQHNQVNQLKSHVDMLINFLYTYIILLPLEYLYVYEIIQYLFLKYFFLNYL